MTRADESNIFLLVSIQGKCGNGVAGSDAFIHRRVSSASLATLDAQHVFGYAKHAFICYESTMSSTSVGF